jgi:hypothetical protein
MAVSTIDFERAARIAREDMEQHRWELSAAVVMMVLTALGLAAFWCWVFL